MPFDSPFSAAKAVGRRQLLLLVESATIDNPGGTKALGQFRFDPALLGLDASYTFQSTSWVSKGTIVGTVQLYNVTDGEAVAGSTLAFGSISPAQATGLLTVGAAAGNLKNTAKIYEVRMSVTGVDASDILYAGSTQIQVS